MPIHKSFFSWKQKWSSWWRGFWKNWREPNSYERWKIKEHRNQKSGTCKITVRTCSELKIVDMFVGIFVDIFVVKLSDNSKTKMVPDNSFKFKWSKFKKHLPLLVYFCKYIFQTTFASTEIWLRLVLRISKPKTNIRLVFCTIFSPI